MAKKRIEEDIRKKLVQNLNFIEVGLTLIDDEYHVKNPNGAGGFIDIFAKDLKGNLVIIELKRSNAASREAITELSKYISLIRRIKNVKNSEVRLIIISTEWNELLVPFSEYYNATNYQLEGYILDIDNANNPIKISKVKPLPLLEGRNVCRRHFARYYKSEEDLKKAQESIASQAINLEINDFIIANFDLNFIDEFYGTKKVLYWAQQLKSKEFYIKKLKGNIDIELFEELLENISDYEDDDQLDELAEKLEDLIDVKCETCEIGYPEKLVQKLENKTWLLSSISKYGVFEADERLTDELLMMDLKGDTGSSFIHYFASTKSENRSKIEEISRKMEVCLFHNEEWRHKISDILNYASNKKDCNITLYIYNTDDLLETLWLAGNDDPLRWVPNFVMILDPESNNENAEIFLGNIRCNKNDIDIEEAISYSFETFDSYLLSKSFGDYKAENSVLMDYLGFEYQTDVIIISGEDENYKKNISIKGKNIVEKKIYSDQTIYDFIDSRTDVIEKLTKLFTERHLGNSFFQL